MHRRRRKYGVNLNEIFSFSHVQLTVNVRRAWTWEFLAFFEPFVFNKRKIRIAFIPEILAPRTQWRCSSLRSVSQRTCLEKWGKRARALRLENELTQAPVAPRICRERDIKLAKTPFECLLDIVSILFLPLNCARSFTFALLVCI